MDEQRTTGRERPSPDPHRLAIWASMLGTACMLATAVACRKDQDRNAPTVNIVAPGAGAQLQVPGVIAVRARVADDRQVTSVRFALLNTDGIPIATGPTVTVNAASAEVEGALALDDEQLRSCACTIAVTASDGANGTRAYRSLQVLEAPLRLRALHVVSTSGGTTTVLRIDSTGAAGLLTELTQDARHAVLSSTSGTLVIAGDVTGPLTALDVDDGSVRWQQPNTNAFGGTFFTGLDRVDGDRLAVARADGQLRAYAARDGGSFFTAQALDGRYPRRTGGLEDLLLSEQPQVAGSGRILAMYTAYTGELQDEQALDLALAGIATLDAERVLLFGERNGDGVVEERNVLLGGGWEPAVLAGQPITALASAPGQVHFLATPAGLMRYTYTSNAVSPLGSDPVDQVARDAVSGALFTAANGLVRRVDASSGTVLQTWSATGTVIALLPCYNREP